MTVERDGMTLVVKDVPALVCPICGEEYVVDETVTSRLLALVEQAAKPGVRVDIRRSIAA